MIKRVFLISIPTFVGLVIGGCLWLWHPRADVLLQLSVPVITFEVEQQTKGRMLDHIETPAFSVNGFKSIELTPEDGSFQVADPRRFDFKSRRYQESAWIKLKAQHIELSPSSPSLDPQAMVIADDMDSGGTIQFKGFSALAGSRVVIEIPGEPPFTPAPNDEDVDMLVRVTPPPAKAELTQAIVVTGPVTVHTAQCGFPGSPYRNLPATYRFTLAEGNPILAVRAAELMMSFRLPPKWSGALLQDGRVRAKGVRFDREIRREGRTGARLVYGQEPNRLVYPSYPDKNIQFTPPQSVVLDQDDVFTLQVVSLNQEYTGIRLTLTGRTKKVISTAGSAPRDLHIDGLDWLKQQTWLMKSLAFALWSVPTTLAILKFVKEFKAEVGS